MPYLNNYQAPTPATKEDRPHEHTRIEDYDYNFALNAREVGMLEGEGRDVRLEPLLVSLSSFLLGGQVKDSEEQGGVRRERERDKVENEVVGAGR